MNDAREPARVAPILVVDDEEVVQVTLKAVLESEGYSVEVTGCAEKALALLEERRYTMMITDVMMPGLSGLDLLRHARTRHPDLPVVVITGFPTVERAIEAIRGGAANFITKPFEIDEVVETVARAVRSQEELAQNCETEGFVVDRIHMRFPTSITHAAGAVHFLFQRTPLADLYAEGTRFQIRLALDESLANAMKHGNRFDPEKTIHVDARIDSHRFDVWIEDEGPGFDPSKVADPVEADVLASLRDGGRGLFLMRCYMDGVDHNESGNRIHLWKENPDAAHLPMLPEPECSCPTAFCTAEDLFRGS